MTERRAGEEGKVSVRVWLSEGGEGNEGGGKEGKVRSERACA